MVMSDYGSIAAYDQEQAVGRVKNEPASVIVVPQPG